MVKNVFFDLDGTIIDSSRCIYSVFKALFKELNLTLPEGKEFKSFIGPPIEATMSKYLTTGVSEAADRYREIYKTVDLMATNILYDGIEEELKKLKSTDKRLYLATTKAEKFAVDILKYKGIFEYFDGVYGVRKDLNRMTKAQVIDAIIAERSLKKSECILIGDTAFDAEGAFISGIKVAIVKYGFGNIEDFEGKKIEFFAEKVGEIAEKIERL